MNSCGAGRLSTPACRDPPTATPCRRNLKKTYSVGSPGCAGATNRRSLHNPPMWNDYRVWAVLSALFAGITAVLAKKGVETVPSNLALFIRVCVVVLFAGAIV